MRMWMVSPKIMCKKHLLGEHVETHMFLGCMIRNKKLQGYINNNLFEVQNLFYRHLELSQEMENRGYNHKSTMNINEYLSYCNNYVNVKINSEASLNDLLDRCSECRKRKEELNDL